jgi:hypothetical protein
VGNETITEKIKKNQQILDIHGFSSKLWIPEHGWQHNEVEAKKTPFDPQYLAALEIFVCFCIVRCTWVHLKAEMQAGKTGVICCLIRLLLNKKNFKKMQIGSGDIYNCTGMSDNAWLKQTRERLPDIMRKNVQHNGGIGKIISALDQKSHLEGMLKNILLVMDESHFASAYNNRPNRILYDKINYLGKEKWSENNIKILTTSATDPASTIGVSQNEHVKCREVELLTTPEYQSVKNLYEENRIRPSPSLKDIESIKAFLESVHREFVDMPPKYHIMRPKSQDCQLLCDTIPIIFPNTYVVLWDSKHKPTRPLSDDSSTASEKMSDINEMLDEEPDVTTFIIIKNMFYASKTLNDAYVGISYDRIGAKDDTTLQSLLGRHCGYGKNKTTIIYTGMQTVHNYLNFWRKHTTTNATTVENAFPKQLNNKMAGIVAVKNTNRNRAVKLSLNEARAFPISMGPSTASFSIQEVRRPKQSMNEAHFHVEWSVHFDTIDKLNEWLVNRDGHRKQFKYDGDGFYICSAPKLGRHHVSAIDNFMGGKKTAHTAASVNWKIGKSGCTSYVAYTDTNDKNTVCYIGCYCKRIAE